MAFALSAQGQPQSMSAMGIAALTSTSGTLVFVDDRPAIKADSGTVFLEMPDFFKYAYLDGIKAGATVKATGMLVSPGAPRAMASAGSDKAPQSGQAVLVAKEVTIGAKTYIIVAGGPNPNRGPAGAPGSDCSPGRGDDRAPGPEQGRK
jgi:hypothetical protein